MRYPDLVSSAEIGQCILKNRIIMALFPAKYAKEGKVTPQVIEFYLKFSKK